jgi:hypothetical protein
MFLLAGLGLASAGPVAAQDADLDPLHYLPSEFSSASEIEASSIQVYRIPLGFTLRDLADERRWGLRLTLPVSFGFYEVTAATDLGDLVERLETITVSPGLELQVAAGSSWVFKPFGEVGVGSTTGGSTDVLYAAGLRSVGRYRLEPVRLTVGGAARYASERSSRSRLQDHTTFEVGADVQLPLGVALGGRETLGGVYGIARFLPEVEVAEDRLLDLGQVYELGVSLSTEPELRVLGVRLPWIALGYRFGDVFSGVRISLSFPF